MIRDIICRIRRSFKSKNNFLDDAREAYRITKYNDKLTKEQLKNKIIEKLRQRILTDIKVSGKFVDVTIYQDYREKLVLPEVVEFFRERNYHVDLLNTENYQEVNVLIINWQNLETFK